MTQIVGTLRDSANNLLSGQLQVTLDAPLVDTSTNPSSLLVASTYTATITNGAIAINLPQSQTSNLTYHFVFNTLSAFEQFYFNNGNLYVGATHQHTDGNYYTGTIHTTDSQLLNRVVTQSPTPVFDFHAIVPNVATVDFASLLPTGITTDILDTSLQRLADILTSNINYRTLIQGGPTPRGAYSQTQYYIYGDLVTYSGGSYVYIYPLSTVGNVPTVNSNNTYWQLIAAQGNTGAGTTGNPNAYDAAAWQNQVDAPSRGTVRDIIEQLARVSQLANYALLNSPVFTGNPQRNASPLSGDSSGAIPTTSWVAGNFASLTNAVFTNPPAVPTPATTNISQAAANTNWVNNFVNSIKAVANGIASLNSSSVIPQAQLGFSQSLSDNGYITFPNGLIFQWGSTAITTNGSGDATINLPIPFTTRTYSVLAVNGDPVANPSNIQVFANPSLSSFGCHTSPVNANAAIRVNWLAIGK